MDETLKISLGAVQSPYDYRDVPLSAVSAVPETFPSQFFIDVVRLPVWNQRTIGACTAHAISKYQQKNELIEKGSIVNLSPRFLYALAKAQDGLPYGEQGTYPRLIAKILQKYGCATESTLPNDTNLPYSDYIDINKIQGSSYDEAKPFSIKNYAFAEMTEDGIKHAIMNGGLSMLLQLGKEWWTNKSGINSWSANEILPLRPPKTVVSGHEVFFYGWDTVEGRTRFHLLNSWSSSWGNNGCGNLFYDEWAQYLIEGITLVDLPDNWQQELNTLPPAQTFHHQFFMDLKFGMTDPEVRNLQIALKIDGTFPKVVGETGYYGPITSKAVLDFWKKYNLTTVIENITLQGKYAGKKTRAKLNEIFS